MGNIETCYQGALTDADRVLVFLREPDNPAALIARGDAYYFLGRFEHALVRRENYDNITYHYHFYHYNYHFYTIITLILNKVIHNLRSRTVTTELR